MTVIQFILTFILTSTIALISSAAKVFFSPSLTLTWTCGFFPFSMTLNGKNLISCATALSPHSLPISRFASKTVFSGFDVS